MTEDCLAKVIMENEIETIMKRLRCTTSYMTRLEGLRSAKNYDLTDMRWRSLKDIVLHLALHDKVFAVKEEAFRICQKNKLTKNGKPIYLGKKDIKYKVSDFAKLFLKIKQLTAMDEFNLELFEDKFKTLNPEMYDVMKYEKKKKFGEWLENCYKTLPKK